MSSHEPCAAGCGRPRVSDHELTCGDDKCLGRIYPTGWDANGSPVETEPRGMDRVRIRAAIVEEIINEVSWPQEYLCNDFDPTPYCSYGHPSEASCDCEPIAENE